MNSHMAENDGQVKVTLAEQLSASNSHHNGRNVGCGVRQPTITIRDTPSPAVSVITISDSDDESGR
jgi:hypothetical protein